MKIETLRALLAAQESKIPTVLTTNLTSGEQHLLAAHVAIEGDLKRAFERTLRSDKPMSIERPDGSRLFLNVFNPPLRLIVVGAVHIAQPLVQMAAVAGYEGKQIVLGIRPEHFVLVDDGDGVMHMKVDHVETLGADTLIHGHMGEDNAFLTVRLFDIHHFQKGTELQLAVPPEKLNFFDQQTEKRIGN